MRLGIFGKKLDKKNESLIWLALTFSAIAFFIIIVIKPTLETIVELNKEIKEKQALSSQLQKKIDSLLKMQEIYARNINKFFLLEEVFPDSPRISNFSRYIERSCLNLNLATDSLSFEKISRENLENSSESIEISKIPFRVSVTGDYLTLIEFYKNLGNSRRVPFIDTLKLELTNKENSPTGIKLTLSGEIYFKKNQKK